MKYTKLNEIRFWSNVNINNSNNSCWTWRASKHIYGYGWFRIDGKTYLAHRLALIFYSGKEEPELQSLHSCNNPTCCNPFHLRWGTPLDNIKDEIKSNSKTDPPTFYGEKHPSAKLNWDKVDQIRKLRINGVTTNELAEKYEVSVQAIYRVISFTNWKPEKRKEGTI